LNQLDLEIGTIHYSGVTVFDLAGELDAYTSERFREAILAQIDAGMKLLVVDFLDVEYIDSSGLGALVAGLKRISERDGHIYVVCQESQVQKVLRITGLNKVFPIYVDRDSAVKAIRQADSASDESAQSTEDK
jgi:anti-sigma B factor antagonist